MTQLPTSNTDSISSTDRAVAGLQPDGSTATGGAGPTGGTTPAGAAGGALAGTYPDPTLAPVVTAAGPIGDGTHVAAVTINAAGQVTALSSISIIFPGTAGVSATIPLAKLTVGGTNGSVTFLNGLCTNYVTPT